jgi:hypothetical protein
MILPDRLIVTAKLNNVDPQAWLPTFCPGSLIILFVRTTLV